MDKRERKGNGYGLIAMEDIEKDDFIIKYMGNIVCEDPMNEYGIRFKGMNLRINASRKETLAKCMNQSCIPNCVNKLWGIKGMPRLYFFCK